MGVRVSVCPCVRVRVRACACVYLRVSKLFVLCGCRLEIVKDYEEHCLSFLTQALSHSCKDALATLRQYILQLQPSAAVSSEHAGLSMALAVVAAQPTAQAADSLASMFGPSLSLQSHYTG